MLKKRNIQAVREFLHLQTTLLICGHGILNNANHYNNVFD